MTKKKKIILLVITIFIILLIPIRSTINDGGTIVYNSLTYKIIDWHEENITYIGGYKTGRDIHFFPSNFKSIKYYSELASDERERNFTVSNVIDSKEKCGSKEKELFYTTDLYEYYFECKKSDNITVVFTDKTTMSLTEALNENLFNPNDLNIYNINYILVNKTINEEKTTDLPIEE